MDETDEGLGRLELTIANGQSDTIPRRLDTGRLVRVMLPAAIDGAFLVVMDGYGEPGTFGVKHKATGDPVLFPIRPGAAIQVPREFGEGMGLFKLRTVGVDWTTPVPQTAARALVVWAFD